jgi:hypothetical protein
LILGVAIGAVTGVVVGAARHGHTVVYEAAKAP